MQLLPRNNKRLTPERCRFNHIGLDLILQQKICRVCVVGRNATNFRSCNHDNRGMVIVEPSLHSCWIERSTTGRGVAVQSDPRHGHGTIGIPRPPKIAKRSFGVINLIPCSHHRKALTFEISSSWPPLRRPPPSQPPVLQGLSWASNQASHELCWIIKQRFNFRRTEITGSMYSTTAPVSPTHFLSAFTNPLHRSSTNSAPSSTKRRTLPDGP